MGKKEGPPTRTINKQPILPFIGLLSTDGFFADSLLADTQMLITDLSNGVESDDKRSRVESTLTKLGERHKEFLGRVFREFDGKYVTVSLLLSSPAELFPDKDDRPASVEESNPIIGTVGVRSAIRYPEVAKMQIDSVVRAAVELKVQGYNPKPRIAVPFVSFPAEFSLMQNQIRNALSLQDTKLDIPCGAIICTPRGALTADELARSADFLIINTDLLTQTTLGMSKVDTDANEDDVVPHYMSIGLFANNPFNTLDVNGVGKLIEAAIKGARKTNPEIEIDVIGSHRGNEAIRLYKRLGVNHLIAPTSYWN